MRSAVDAQPQHPTDIGDMTKLLDADVGPHRCLCFLEASLGLSALSCIMDQDLSQAPSSVEMPYLRSSSVSLGPAFEDFFVKFTYSALPALHLNQEGLSLSSRKNVYWSMRCCTSATQPPLFSESLKNPVLPTTAARVRS